MGGRVREWGTQVSEEPGSARLIAGRYRLLSPLGQGGMGTVWRARDEVLHREVAVKEVRAPAGLPADDVRRLYARLEREAWAAARVAHRNVVTVYDVAAEDGRPWIVMELVRGVSLADVLEAEGPMAPRRAAHVGAEVLAALRAAHEAGVLHRDVKPANVLLANDGRVVLTDFGIATVEGSSALTMTGEVIGSPEFLAPERALGRTPGPESDLWSLGVLLYAAVEGVSPFRQDTPLSTLRAIVDEELPPPRRAGPLAPVIEGLLRKDPAQRITADQTERDLRLVAAGGTPGAPSATAPTTPLSATAPTVGAGFPAGAPTTAYQAPPPVPPTGPAAAQPAFPEPRRRDRRTVAVLVAGVAALVLAIGGLTYALLNGGGDGDGGEGRATGASSPAVETSASGAADDGDDEDEGGSQPSSTAPSTPETSPSTSHQAPLTVEVTVAGANTHYTGVCPPPQDRAPRFTATFTVSRVPAEVRYRWRSSDGDVTDGGWRTLSFGAADARTKQDTVVATTQEEDGTFDSDIRVEVNEPGHVTSNTVPFTVACQSSTAGGGSTPSGHTGE